MGSRRQDGQDEQEVSVLKVRIRWLIRRDMPEVLSIENKSFESPWDEEDFLVCLRQRNCVGMVAESEDGEQVVGFMVYELHQTYIKLLNIACLQQHRGVGRALIERLAMKLKPARRRKIRTCVRERNLAAQLFFKKLGFVATTIIRGTFADDEDAYIMEFCRDQGRVSEMAGLPR